MVYWHVRGVRFMKINYSNKMSISFSKAKKTETSLRHNNRNFTEEEKESFHNKHVDFSRSDQNNTLVKKDIHEAYDEIFGEALAEYNAKQKRSDRKIDDYYSKVFHDKRMSTQKEFLIQVGKKEDFEDDVDGKKWETANKILENYCKSFEKRNPKFKIYNAVIHNDESCPHLHLNVIPIAEGYKRGLQKQPSFDKALRQQFKMDKENSGSSFDVFQKFRDQEVKKVESELEKNKIGRLEVGTNAIENYHEYKKVVAKIEELKEEVLEEEEELEAVEGQVEELKEFRDHLASELETTHVESIEEYNSEEYPQDKFAVISREDFNRLEEQNELVPILVKRNKILSKENQELSEENEAQSEQLSQLRKVLELANRHMERIFEGGSKVWNRAMTYASKFHSSAREVIPEEMQQEPSGEEDYKNWRERAARVHRER